MDFNTAWSALEKELFAWQQNDAVANLWWRDDDLTCAGPQAQALLEMTHSYQIPIGLAVIPQTMDIELPDWLTPFDHITVLQHGIAHENHAAEQESKLELGGNIDNQELKEQLHKQLGRLVGHFGQRFLPILVPPWNRIDKNIVSELKDLGFAGISTFGDDAYTGNGLLQCNTHIDIIDWRGTRNFIGEDKLIKALTTELSKRRTGNQSQQPIGLLTHHIVHTPAAWESLQRMIENTRDHPAIQWRSPYEAFTL